MIHRGACLVRTTRGILYKINLFVKSANESSIKNYEKPNFTWLQVAQDREWVPDFNFRLAVALHHAEPLAVDFLTIDKWGRHQGNLIP